MNEENEIPKAAPEIDTVPSAEKGKNKAAPRPAEMNTTPALSKAEPVNTEQGIQTMEVHTHGHVHAEKNGKSIFFNSLCCF